MLALFFLNTFGGIIAGIWLAILGEWKIIFSGLAATIGGPFLLSFPLMLTMIFAVPAMALIEKGKVKLAIPLLAIVMILKYIILGVWCLGSLVLFLEHETSSNLIPLLIWSYGVAVGPWMYMGKSERDNEHTIITIFSAQAGYLTAVVCYLFGADLAVCIYAFSAFLLLGLTTSTAIEIFRRERRMSF